MSYNAHKNHAIQIKAGKKLTNIGIFFNGKFDLLFIDQ